MGSFNASLKTIGDTKGIPATVELQEGRLSIKAGDSEIGDWPLDEIGLEPTPTGYKLAAEGDQVLLDMSDSEQFTEELQQLSKNGRRKKEEKKKKKKQKKLSLFSRKEKKTEEDDTHETVEAAPATPPEPVEPVRDEPVAAAGEPASRIPDSVMRASSPSREPAAPVAPDVPPEPVSAEAATAEPVARTPETDAEAPSFFARLVAMLDRTIDITEKRWGPLLPGWVFNRIVFVAGFVLLVLAFVFRGTTSIVLLVTGVLALMIGGAAYTDDVMASKLLPGRATPTHLMIVGIGLLAVGIGFGFIA